MNEFFAQIYETLHFNPELSPLMWNIGLYSTLGIISILLALFSAILFYYIINSPKFSKFLHWLIILLAAGFISLVVGIVLLDNQFAGLQEFSMIDYSQFSIWYSLVCILQFVIFSFLIRWWSTNAKGTPYPN